MGAVTNAEYHEWVKDVMERENIYEYQVKENGNSGIGDGYIGDIVFLTVTGKIGESESKIFHFVMKHGKRNEQFRVKAPVREAFLNEITAYDKIFPELIDFQKSKNPAGIFDAIPKCYGTLLQDNMEVIVLGDLKAQGYQLHDRQKAMDHHHIELILKEYARFHAVSFAMKDQNLDKYRELIGLTRNVSAFFNDASGLSYSLKKILNSVFDFLEENSYLVVTENLRQFLEEIPEMMSELLESRDDPYTVIKHGDGWSNNFMFKYKEEVKKVPETVCILDWQNISVASPVIDVSYLIFTCCSKKELDNVDGLLRMYYKFLSEYMFELGSDPLKVYPFKKLMEHWWEKAKFGAMMAPLKLKFCLCNKDECPDFAVNLAKGLEFKEVFEFRASDFRRYHNRMIELMTHSTYLNVMKHN